MLPGSARMRLSMSDQPVNDALLENGKFSAASSGSESHIGSRRTVPKTEQTNECCATRLKLW